MIFRSSGGQLEYDFVVAPGVSSSVIRLRFDGADSVRLDREGALVLGIGERQIRQPKPFVFQETAGGRLDQDLTAWENMDIHGVLYGVARLKPGVTLEQARADMDGIAANLLGSRLRGAPAGADPFFGGTLEWWVGRELERTLRCDVATGVRSGAPGVGGDLDVVVPLGAEAPEGLWVSSNYAFYNPDTPARVWHAEFENRFGKPAAPQERLALPRGGH